MGKSLVSCFLTHGVEEKPTLVLVGAGFRVKNSQEVMKTQSPIASL